MTTMTTEITVEQLVVDMVGMSWNDLRSGCKSLKINTGGMSRTDLENKLRAMAPEPTIESQEARIRSLEADLSEKLSPPIPQSQPLRTLTPEQQRIEQLEAKLAAFESGGEPAIQFGPAYHAFPNADLRSLCLARNVMNQGSEPAHGVSNRLEMIARLQQMDAAQGLKPRPSSEPIKVQDAVPTISLSVTDKNAAAQPVQNCRFLIDQAGNKVITVHQHGRKTSDGPTILPMEDNVRRIIESFNGVGE